MKSRDGEGTGSNFARENVEAGRAGRAKFEPVPGPKCAIRTDTDPCRPGVLRGVEIMAGRQESGASPREVTSESGLQRVLSLG